MKTLTTWFEVLDFFGGDTAILEGYYEPALKIAEARGVTFTQELFYETARTALQP